MSIWGRIIHAIASATGTVASAAADAAAKAAAAGQSAVDQSRDTGIFAGDALRDRSVIFRQGWKQVFSGEVNTGLGNVGYGMAQLVTGPQPPPPDVASYTNAVGDATLSAAQQYSRNENQPICYSAYLTQFQFILANRGLAWTDDMDGRLREFVTAQDLYWINLGC